MIGEQFIRPSCRATTARAIAEGGNRPGESQFTRRQLQDMAANHSDHVARPDHGSLAGGSGFWLSGSARSKARVAQPAAAIEMNWSGP